MMIMEILATVLDVFSLRGFIIALYLKLKRNCKQTAGVLRKYHLTDLSKDMAIKVKILTLTLNIWANGQNLHINSGKVHL